MQPDLKAFNLHDPPNTTAVAIPAKKWPVSRNSAPRPSIRNNDHAVRMPHPKAILQDPTIDARPNSPSTPSQPQLH